MNSFIFIKPKEIEELFDLLDDKAGNYKLLAGGTDLLVRLKSGRISPEVVIDIKQIPALNSGIVIEATKVTIGALTLMAKLESNDFLEANFPALTEAVHNIGSVQIRNRATIAGNLCNASPAADSAPALLIYNASVVCLSRKGERTLPLSEFIIGPGKTALSPEEIVKQIVLPMPSKNQGAAFSRLTRRKGVDLATINLCCQVNQSGLTRFALGAVGPVPFVVEETEGCLLSSELSSEEKKSIISGLMGKATPISDVRASKEYRQAMLTVLGWRAFNSAVKRLHDEN